MIIRAQASPPAPSHARPYVPADLPWPPTWEHIKEYGLDKWENAQERSHNCTDVFFHVLVPFHNVPSELLFKNLASILAQDYPLFRMHYFDDGSDLKETIEAFKILCTAVDVSRLNCISGDHHLGPGYGKFRVLTEALKSALPQDVLVIVDGDDFLSGRNALKIINRMYGEKKCWNTWGSMKGKYAEQQGPLPEDILKDDKPLVRKNLHKWTFSHPRSFKAFLGNYLTETDFKDESNRWLLKVSDRNFFFDILELSGASRSCFVEQVVYAYVWGATPTTESAVTPQRKHQLLRYVSEVQPLQRLAVIPEHARSKCDDEAHGDDTNELSAALTKAIFSTITTSTSTAIVTTSSVITSSASTTTIVENAYDLDM